MKRYHLNAKGAPGVCNAKNGKCPFGGADVHTMAAGLKEARVWAEKVIAEEFDGGIFGVTRREAEVLDSVGIMEYSQSSEHTEYGGKFYGYIQFKMASRPEPVYVPQDTRGRLVNNTAIWSFIKEIPQELFENEEISATIARCTKRDGFWSAH